MVVSKQSSATSAITIHSFSDWKNSARKITAVTCYDSSFGRLIEQSAIDLVLVGDSLGNVILGRNDTLSVTLEEMIHHGAAVRRVVNRPLVCIDMPFGTYQVSGSQGLCNAIKIMQATGAQAVKVEGGREIADTVQRIVAAGIPVVGHLGLTPQKIHSLGGYKVQGRSDAAASQLIDDAKALQEAGIFALVLEMLPRSLGSEITKLLKVPTIGIGAGPDTDGQILVLQDLLGFDDTFSPKFLKKYANFSALTQDALACYCSEVRAGKYPSQEHTFS